MNNEAHATVSGDGEATVVTESRDIVAGDFAGLKNRHTLWDIVAGDFAGLKNRHTLSIVCSWLVKWTQASTTRGKDDRGRGSGVGSGCGWDCADDVPGAFSLMTSFPTSLSVFFFFFLAINVFQ